MNYLFYLAKGYSIPVIRPIANYLAAHRPNDQFRFFVARPLESDIIDSWGADRLITTIKEARAFAPDCVLCPGNYVDFRIPGLKVQLFHGVGVEKESHYQIRHFFDVYCTSGPIVTERFNKMAEHHGYFRVIETGWPKFDHILNFDRTNLDHRLPDVHNKRIVLYAPTFSRKMQSGKELAHVIPSIIRDDEFWIIKFHELMDHETIQLFRSLPANNVMIITNEDITPYLHMADVMISDTSSVVYEFSCLGKPVITFRTTGFKEKAIDISEPEQLRPTLDLLLDNPAYKSAQRTEQLRRVNPYLDGHIAERLINKLETLSDQWKTTPPRKRKPINLFRKAKVLYMSRFNREVLQ